MPNDADFRDLCQFCLYICSLVLPSSAVLHVTRLKCDCCIWVSCTVVQDLICPSNVRFVSIVGADCLGATMHMVQCSVSALSIVWCSHSITRLCWILVEGYERRYLAGAFSRRPASRASPNTKHRIGRPPGIYNLQPDDHDTPASDSRWKVRKEDRTAAFELLRGTALPATAEIRR